ncbi:gliding motility-associated-like protein [Mucilaginibacter sp. UYP25]|uniref:gliding motility-associated C-terminal domain-containing protein n=1 Tax=unclassified Mucilaginibacter TaxID=2617802 RepID=UPI003398F404
MLTYKRRLLLLAIAVLFAVKAHGQVQYSLGDPVLSEDFGFGGPYSPVGPPLPDANTTMKSGGDGRCPGPGRYLVLNTSANCYGDTFSTINFDHSGTSPYGYLMMVNGDDKPVTYYTNVISGSKFCPGQKYRFAVFLKNINTQMPRPAGYADANILFTVKAADGTILTSTPTGAFTEEGFKEYHADFVVPNDGSDVTVSLSNAALTGTIGNDFAIDDITVKPYGPVINAGIGSPTGPASATQCLDNHSVRYILKAEIPAYATPQYQWQLNYNKKGWVNVAGETNADIDLRLEFLAPAAGKYEYRVGVISAPGASLNCQTFSLPVVINVVKNPEFKLPAITYVCKGDALSIHADGGTDYLWTYPDGHTSDSHFLDVTGSVDESFEGIYTVVITSAGCSLESKTEVRVVSALDAKIETVDPKVCAGQGVQLTATGGLSYRWEPTTGLDNPNVANPIANPASSTYYSVFVSNEGCTQQRTVLVTVLELAGANAGTDRGMTEGETISLEGKAEGANITHYWTPPDYMDDPTSLTPKVNPPDNKTYTLHVESADCGSFTDEMNVRVFKKLIIPSSFSPNADGINDTWHIDKLYTYPESVLSVYTREGAEVFRTVGDARQWNGIFNGQALPPGTYYYVIDLKNNLPKRSGWVLLLK